MVSISDQVMQQLVEDPNFSYTAMHVLMNASTGQTRIITKNELQELNLALEKQNAFVQDEKPEENQELHPVSTMTISPIPFIQDTETKTTEKPNEIIENKQGQKEENQEKRKSEKPNEMLENKQDEKEEKHKTKSPQPKENLENKHDQKENKQDLKNELPKEIQKFPQEVSPGNQKSSGEITKTETSWVAIPFSRAVTLIMPEGISISNSTETLIFSQKKPEGEKSLSLEKMSLKLEPVNIYKISHLPEEKQNENNKQITEELPSQDKTLRQNDPLYALRQEIMGSMPKSPKSSKKVKKPKGTKQAKGKGKKKKQVVNQEPEPPSNKMNEPETQMGKIEKKNDAIFPVAINTDATSDTKPSENVVSSDAEEVYVRGSFHLVKYFTHTSIF